MLTLARLVLLKPVLGVVFYFYATLNILNLHGVGIQAPELLLWLGISMAGMYIQSQFQSNLVAKLVVPNRNL